MPNIIINPNSGIIEFNTGSASGSAFDSSLQGASRLEFQNSGELNLTSLGTGVADKFTIDGSNGRLLTVNNTVTGSIFSVNDVAGLPIVEVFSDDRVVMGQYATDALVVSGSGVSFATPPTVNGNPVITGSSSSEGDTLQTVTDRGATTTNSIHLDSNSAQLQFGDANNMQIFHNSAKGEINVSAGDFEIDSAGDIILDAEGNDILFKDAGSTFGKITNNSQNLEIHASTNDKDIVFKGFDNGAAITAMTIDMSEGGNVGIGTNNPHALLEVSNNSDDATLIVSNKTNGANGAYLRLLEAGTDFNTYGYLGGYIQYDGNNNLINIGRHNVNGTTFSDDIPAISIKRSDGNVGIGITGPAQKLHVNGNAIVGGVVQANYFEGTAGTRSYFNGNVGIGTNNPSAELEIASSTATLRLTDSDLSSHFSEIEKAGIYLSFYSRANTANGGFIFIGDNGTTDTEFLRIDTAGNVGIGSNSPSAPLDIKAAVANNAPLLKLRNENNSNGASIQFIDQSTALQPANITYRHADSQSQGGGASFNFTGEPDLTLVVGDSTNKGRMVVSSAGSVSEADYGFYDNVNMGMSRMSSNELGLITAGVERVRVDSDGKVGIGTNDPSVPLEVNGNIKCNALSAGVGIELHTSSTTNFLSSQESANQLVIRNTGPNKDIVFQVSDGSLSEILRLDASLHTVNVNGKLKLNQASNEVIMSDGSLRIDIDNNNDQTDRVFVISKHNAATELMRVQEDGKVGIGTNNPETQLQVDTPATNQIGNGIRINRPAAGTHYHALEFSTDGTCDWSIGQNAADALEIYENGGDATTRLTILEGGNVGIGSDNPFSKLHVEDTSSTQAIRAYNGSHFAAMGANSNAAWITAGGNPAHGLRLSAGGNGSLSVYASRGVAIGEYPTTDPGADNLSVAGIVKTTEIESSGALLLDAALDITIDAGGQDIILSDDGTIFGTLSNSSGFQIRSRVNNADMLFRGVDGGTEFTALTLDMSEGGNATFAGSTTAKGNVTVTNTGSGNAYLKAFATGTGAAGLYIDAVDGDAAGSDYFSLRQLDNKAIEFNARTGTGNTLFYSKGLLNLTQNGANSTFAGDVVVSGGDITLGGTGRIQGIDTVSSGTDATSKTYVDNAITTGLGSYLPLTGGTMTGNIVLGSNNVNFKTGGNSTSPNFFGHRSSTDLDSRFTTSEAGWSYTTFNANSSNAPSSGLHNGNGLLSFNTHAGNYGHQIAMTTSTQKIWFRTNNNGGFGDWQQIFTDAYHPNADTLTTARTINGVSFDGSANITVFDSTKLPLSGGTLTGNLTIGSDTNEKDFIVYGNDTGEKLSWDGSESKLQIYHDTNDFGLGIFTVSSASMSQPQLKVGRDQNQYWGVYTEDRNARLIHRQDETSGSMTTRFVQWDSNTSDTNASWVWEHGNGSGGNIANAMTLTQAGNLTIAGKVGIGTDAPAFTNGSGLEIEATTATLRLQKIGANAAELNMGASSFDIRDLSSGHINYYVSNNIKWKMNADGFHSQNIANGISFYGDSSLNHAIVSRNTLGSNADDLRINSYGAVYINLDSNNNNTSGADFAIGRHGGGTGTIANTSFFYLNGENGNLGLGTTGPTEKLHVEGRLRLGTTPVINSHDDITIDIDSNNNQSDRRFAVTKDGEATELMRVQENGNVGIGSNAPAHKLDVDGYVQVQNSADSSSRLYLKGGRSYFLTSTVGGDFGLYDDDVSAYRLYVKNNGNVGIGTNNPLGLLMLRKDQTAPTRLIISNGGTANASTSARLSFYEGIAEKNYIERRRDGSGDFAFVSPADDNPFVFENSSGEFVRFVNSKVGIGTNNPSSVLHVSGGSGTIPTLSTSHPLTISNASNSGICIISGNTSSVGQVVFGDPNDADVGRIRYQHSDNSLRFWTDANERVAIDSSGKVGIGITNPNAKLKVNGVIFSQGGNYTSGVETKTDAGLIMTKGDYLYSDDGNYPRRLLGHTSSGVIEIGQTGTSLISDIKLHPGTSGNILFFASGSEDVRINSSGNVLIKGANDNSNKADFAVGVGGSPRVSWHGNQVQIGGTDMNYNGNITHDGTFRMTSWSSPINFMCNSGSGSNSRDISFTPFNGTSPVTSVTMKGAGQVGIGTDNPSDGDLTINAPILHVKGPDTASAYNLVARFQAGNDSDNTGASIVINHGNDRGLLIKAGRKDSDREVAFFDLISSGANLTNMLTMGKYGSAYNVGIRTTSPQAELDVAGEIRAESNMTLGSDGTFGSAYGAIGIGTTNLTNGHHRIFAKSSDHMYFAASSSKGFRFRPNGGTSTASAGVTITSAGRLGVGITNPSSKMAVGGGVAIGASYVSSSAPSNGAIIQGNVGIGTSNPSYALQVNGAIVGNSKSFLIDHPTKEGKQLLHACIEGPEHAVYFRGRSNLNIITMPDYWEGLVDLNTMTVDLTAIGANQNIYVDSITENGDVTVGSNTNEPLNYFYVVYGERKDIDKLEIEIIKPEYSN